MSAGAQPTVEDWCERFITSRDGAHKLRPGTPPGQFRAKPRALRLSAPGRPAAWSVVERAERVPRSLAESRSRAQLLHTLAHHELQAAELFAYGVLAFAESPPEFRKGLLRLCQDELRHLNLLVERIQALGFEFGEFALRDWFWLRVPTCQSPAEFVSLMGLGLEGANLEHSARFANALRAAGDNESAEVLELIGAEEVAHVAFAGEWFERFKGEPLGFDLWKATLPKPLTPSILKGDPINRGARRAAGQSDEFVDRLSAEPRAGC